jgi:hypothetical protein
MEIIILLYKLLKRIFFNLFIEINNTFNNLKLNNHHHMTTILKQKPEYFINEIVNDLCNKKMINSEDFLILNNNIKNIDKRITLIDKRINNNFNNYN